MKRLVSLIVVLLATACLAYRSSGQETDYAPLEVFTSGPGRISHLHDGQLLEVGKTYSMEAIPEPGFAFYNWEWVDVFIETTRIMNESGGVVTNVEKRVTSKKRFFNRPELIFIPQPVWVQVLSDQLTTTSGYGWRANFGPIREPVEPNVYRTMTGAVAEERGDLVPNESRVVPISATLSFDFSTTPPSLTAEIPNAVLEGGVPFPLTVRSYYGQSLSNGAYQFSGDYLQDVRPSGTQYLFDWRFSTSSNGDLVWNGTTVWAGGHIWQTTISNLTLVPLARLSISRAGAASVQLSWATQFSDYVLESASKLPTAGWSPIANQVITNGNRVAVTVETNASQRFYRLRKP